MQHCPTHHQMRPYNTGLMTPVHHATKKKCENNNGSKVTKFSINIHGIHQHHRKYYFKCVVAKYHKTFNKIKNWNIHHCIFHKTKFKCKLCGKQFVTPSSHCAHKNFHVPHKYTCNLCKKTFAFQSELKQHTTVHTRLRLHRCFYGSYTKTFKWPQDLMHHVQQHMHGDWLCKICKQSFAEKRLLQCHSWKHVDIYKYSCDKCTFKTKWPTLYKRHMKIHT